MGTESLWVVTSLKSIRSREIVLAALNHSDLSLDTWEISPFKGSSVRGMIHHDDKLFICGDFLEIAGQYRLHLASVNRLTGALDLTWNPMAEGSCNTIQLQNQRIFVGGKLGGFHRKKQSNLLALDRVSGALCN